MISPNGPPEKISLFLIIKEILGNASAYRRWADTGFHVLEITGWEKWKGGDPLALFFQESTTLRQAAGLLISRDNNSFAGNHLRKSAKEKGLHRRGG